MNQIAKLTPLTIALFMTCASTVFANERGVVEVRAEKIQLLEVVEGQDTLQQAESNQSQAVLEGNGADTKYHIRTSSKNTSYTISGWSCTGVSENVPKITAQLVQLNGQTAISASEVVLSPGQSVKHVYTGCTRN